MDPVFHGWAQKGLDENGFKNGGTKKEFEFRKRLFERILFEGEGGLGENENRR